MMILNIRYFITGISSTVANNQKVWKSTAKSFSKKGLWEHFDSDIKYWELPPRPWVSAKDIKP